MTTLQLDHVEAAAVRDWLDRPDAVTVLDVRTPAEFQTAHIRGSYNLPLTLLAEHAEQIAARLDRQVVLVCRSGRRACEAQRQLAGVGADRVHVLDGGLTAYTASKHAVAGISKTLALELGKYGITVNYLLPGAIHTGMTAASFQDEKIRAIWAKKAALRRLGQPIDMARQIDAVAQGGGGFRAGGDDGEVED